MHRPFGASCFTADQCILICDGNRCTKVEGYIIFSTVRLVGLAWVILLGYANAMHVFIWEVEWYGFSLYKKTDLNLQKPIRVYI